MTEKLELSVYEFNTGKLVLKTTQNRLNMHRLKKGLYVVRLVIGEQLETFKIQV